MTSKKYLLKISEREANWLDDHPELNKSGLFQKVVSILMEKNEPVLQKEELDRLVRGFVK